MPEKALGGKIAGSVPKNVPKTKRVFGTFYDTKTERIREKC